MKPGRFKYAIGAMQPIDPEYTKNTFAEGDRVKAQLDRRLATPCDYRYQGSVTNETHIKARSDIDLLVITQLFYTLERPQVPSSPYRGNPEVDLLSLRNESVHSLRTAFPEATLLIGNKSIAMEGGSLRRKIDVVPANWYDTNDYKQYSHELYRGVYILDANLMQRFPNTPFLHNALIDREDGATKGGLRKAIRLMKSLKYDSDNICLSSYDIASIGYRIPTEYLIVEAHLDLSLVTVCKNHCKLISEDAGFRENLDVPDKHRKIFGQGHATLSDIQALTKSLAELEGDILRDNIRSFQKLAEARVAY